VHRNEGTDVDMGVGLVLTLWSCPKEVMEKTILGASSRNGAPEIGRTGTPSIELISWGFIRIV
jgi:hypothetical protein